MNNTSKVQGCKEACFFTRIFQSLKKTHTRVLYLNMNNLLLVIILLGVVFASGTVNCETETQRQALVELFASTNGSGWIESGLWNTSVSYCQWYGVECDNEGNVVTLNLYLNNLQGSIPSSVSHLSQLSILDVTGNGLYGIVPAELSQLERLENAFLSKNFLTGNPFLGLNSPAMSIMSLGYNQFSSLDTPLAGRMTQLWGISVSGNPLNGPLPDSICLLSGMVTFYASGSGLTGPLPACLGNWTKLLALTIDNNQLTGPFPDLRSAEYFNALTMHNNLFEGELDIALMNWPNVLNVAGNRYTSVNRLSFDFISGAMMMLDLSNNLFGGSIDDLGLEVFGPQLGYLNIMDNPFNCSSSVEDCLPGSFLHVDMDVTERVGEALLCPVISSVLKTRSAMVSIDAIGLIQCTCVDGYFRANGTQNVTCLPCPVGCECHDGVLRDCYPVPFDGVWQQALPCPHTGLHSTACNHHSENMTMMNSTRSGQWNAVQFQCAVGYEERLCASCSVGYFKSGRQCHECAPALKGLIPMVGVVGLLIFMIYSLNAHASSVSILKIFLFYVQSLLVLVHTGAVQWPAPTFVSTSDRVSAAASLSLTALECVVEGLPPVGHLSVYTITPVLYMLVLYGVFKVLPCLIQLDYVHWRDRCVRAAVMFLQFSYFGIAVHVLDSLSCTLQDPITGEYYLNSHPSISCTSSGAFPPLAALAVIAFVVVIVAAPCYLGWILLRNQQYLYSDQSVQDRFATLYARYRKGCWYFEGILTGWRFLLSLVISMTPYDRPSISVLLLCALLLAGLLLSLQVAPYTNQWENRMSTASYAVLLFSFAVAYVVRQSNLTSNVDSSWLLYVAMLVCGLFGILLALTCIVTMGKVFMPKLQALMHWIHQRCDIKTNKPTDTTTTQQPLLVKVIPMNELAPSHTPFKDDQQ